MCLLVIRSVPSTYWLFLVFLFSLDFLLAFVTSELPSLESLNMNADGA
jgi:hypothetical protein